MCVIIRLTASRIRADLRSVAEAQIAAALGTGDPPAVRVFARSRQTGAVACEVRDDGRRLFARVYPIPDVAPRAPKLRPSDHFRSPEPEGMPARDLVAREWTALVELGELDGADGGVPEPIARTETVLLCAWVEGVPLQKVARRARRLRGQPGGLTAAMRNAGTWLRRLHASTAVEEGILDLDEEVAAVAGLSDKAPPRAQRLLALARDLLVEAGGKLGATRIATAVTVTHGDFSLPNLLVTPSGLVIVDFEHFGRRLALHDVVAFVANLRAKLIDPRYRRDDVVAWESAFWQGYGPSATDRLLGGVLATTWLLWRFAPHKLNLPWARAALAVADRLGRGFREDLLRAVTWPADAERGEGAPSQGRNTG